MRRFSTKLPRSMLKMCYSRKSFGKEKFHFLNAYFSDAKAYSNKSSNIPLYPQPPLLTYDLLKSKWDNMCPSLVNKIL